MDNGTETDRGPPKKSPISCVQRLVEVRGIPDLANATMIDDERTSTSRSERVTQDRDERTDQSAVPRAESE